MVNFTGGGGGGGGGDLYLQEVALYFWATACGMVL